MKIGVDLGGTNMRASLVDNGIIKAAKIIPCPSQASQEVIYDSLVKLIESVIENKIESIGIGVPSVVDANKGIVYNVANIPSWKEIHLKDMLQKRFNVPVFVNNDANCFALGTKLFGVAKEYHNIVGITLGTGLGGGIIINDKLYNGSNTGAGEIGSLPYLKYDFEHYCSSGFFTTYYNITGADAAVKACQGDKSIIDMWNEFGIHIGHLIKAVLLTYDPEIIVLGGGISSAFNLYEKSMWKVINSFPYPETIKRLKVLVSDINDIALLGASALGENV